MSKQNIDLGQHDRNDPATVEDADKIEIDRQGRARDQDQRVPQPDLGAFPALEC